MSIKNLNINKKKVYKVTLLDKIKIHKKKALKHALYTVVWTTMTVAIGSSVLNVLTAPKKANDYNIYSNRKLVITKEEQKNIIKNAEKKYNIKVDKDEKDSILFFDSVEKNKKLNKKEKIQFYGLSDMIEDNPYINKEKAYSNLLNLDIKHKNDLGEEGLYGYWDGDNIYLNDSDEYYENNTFFHEAIHAIHNDNPLMPKFLNEGMCELLNSEYNRGIPMSYYEYIDLVEMLCETVGSNTVLKTYSTGDMDCIYNKMAKIQGTTEDAYKLINKIGYLTNDLARKNLKHKEKDNLKTELMELRKYHNLKKHGSKDVVIDVDKDFFDNYYMELLGYIDNKLDINIPIAHKRYFNKKLKEVETPQIGLEDIDESKSRKNR